ncbi:hypothetical protein MPDQ_004268 [Monascus purpureus]|uniref:Putative transcription factor kapC n=1 Tax=Monascus purpureus TaxID=5098 RepID=A0A507QHM1_MONPU|nr:hypothetical protein MPDQ_004268 [Monascus purpureus]
MQPSAQDHADQVLHDQLLAAQQHLSAHQHQAPPRTHPSAPQPHTASPRDQHNIDPAIAGPSLLSRPPELQARPESPSDDGVKTYGKRPLSTSKRAAQNRAAQRAFRQRKETYIRKLEEQVKQFEQITESYKALHAENYQLREYIISLQSRLLDLQGEVPELPPNIDLSQPRPELPIPSPTGAAPGPAGSPHTSAPPSAAQQGHLPHGQTPGPNDDLNSLNRIAVAGLGMRKHPNEDPNYPPNNMEAKRMRNDGNQADASGVPKSEPPNGLPAV